MDRRDQWTSEKPSSDRRCPAFVKPRPPFTTATPFGAAFAASGWSPISKIFDTLASRFSKCRSWEYEIVAADASGDLAYIVGIEHTTAAVGGAAPEPYRLRVTTNFRRENGDWKVVHRHADPVPDDTGTPAQLARFKDQQPGR